MAGVLHFFLLLFLHCASFILVSAGPDDDTAAVRPTVSPDAAFTTTESLFSAGKTNGTEVPTTGFTTSYSKSTTKPPKTTTTTEHLTEDAGKAAERAVSRKDTEEEEGPLELGEWILFYILYLVILMLFVSSPVETVFLWKFVIQAHSDQKNL